MDRLKIEGQNVVFALNNQYYSLSINEVIEIIRIQKITEVVGTKDYISGVINLRGKIIPVVQLRKRYNLPLIPFDKKTRIIIVQDDGENIGLIVDEVKMVTDVDEKDVEPAIDMFNTIEKDCFLGFAKVSNQLIGILNLKKILFPELIEKEVNVSE